MPEATAATMAATATTTTQHVQHGMKKRESGVSHYVYLNLHTSLQNLTKPSNTVDGYDVDTDGSDEGDDQGRVK